VNEVEIAKCQEFIRTIRDEDCYVPMEVYYGVIDYFEAMRPTITYAGLIDYLVTKMQDYCREQYS
jgi:hypothetical protein